MTSQLMDIVGTGGEQVGYLQYFDGVRVCRGRPRGCSSRKHGNRRSFVKMRAADVLEALGANINLSPEKCRSLLEETGICFFFAPKYHESMPMWRP
jgi:anthranilate phosphoribosyltransferase